MRAPPAIVLTLGLVLRVLLLLGAAVMNFTMVLIGDALPWKVVNLLAGVWLCWLAYRWVRQLPGGKP